MLAAVYEALKRLIHILVDVPLATAVIRHSTGSALAVTCVWGLTRLVRWQGTESSIAHWLDSTDAVVLKGVVIYLVIQLAIELLKRLWQEIGSGWNEKNFLVV